MSYLDLPRINFYGKFLASPATLNNTPNNYNPENYPDDVLDPKKIELYWEPKGDSIFNLVECTVTAVAAPGVETDSIVGASVIAMTSNMPPKLVDLDPMQQNVSEIWGLIVRIGDFGGAYVQGTFSPIAFNAIWQNSQGANTPGNSTSGSAVYHSNLTNLQWNVGDSAILKKLQEVSPNRLSIRMTVNAHNNMPQIYLFNDTTFAAMAAAGVPAEVLASIANFREYAMQFKQVHGKLVPQNPGQIPTVSYVNDLLLQRLGEATANQWGPTILATTAQPYEPWIDYKTGKPLPVQPLYAFNYGQLVGSVGPCLDDEPTYAVPSRMLAVPTNPSAPVAGWSAPAILELDPAKGSPSLTMDLSNSLPVEYPGRPLWDKLGKLSLAYYEGSGDNKKYTTIVDSIDYTNAGFIHEQSGIVVITNFGDVDPQNLANLPLALLSTPAGETKGLTFLEENAQGLSMRADQFVFRMNPGVPTTPDFPRGETSTVDIYVRKFGRVEGTDAWQVALNVLDPEDAAKYTLATMGTSGTNGITAKNMSTPIGKLVLSAATVPIENGIARVNLTALDPGNPRGYIDGQVYFTQYTFSPAVADFNQDPNDLISARIYQETPIEGTPSWTNGIGPILQQYGMLYPIMGRLCLWSYLGVVQNRSKIQRVITMDISEPLHMPVTRDLSDIRCKLIVEWFDNDMPYGPIGPVGGPGTNWDNQPAVRGWGAMTGVNIRAGDVVDAIQPVYGTNVGPMEGGPKGTLDNVIFDPGDELVSIMGFTGLYFGAMQIVQISFKTAAGKTYGPYGSMLGVDNPRAFTLDAPDKCAIRSFVGATCVHTDGTVYLAAIGGNVFPLVSLLVSRAA